MVGGHYYSDSIESDPWAPVTYSAGNAGIALGTAEIEIGAAQDIAGRAMVVHDSTGARVAGALLPADFFHLYASTGLRPYPGYAGDLKVRGYVGAYYSAIEGKVSIRYTLSGLQAEECKTAPAGVSNACGIHIHAGNTCDDASMVGGHYYSDSIESDPWAPVTYSAGNAGIALGTAEIEIGAAQDIAGRAMVVHDSTGGRVACALLPAKLFHQYASTGLRPYPGYTGDLKVSGYVGAHYSADEGKVSIRYTLSGLEAEECKTAPAGVSNACGVHIHVGNTCDDASMVGGHYYSDSIESDPWAPVTYSAGNAGIAQGTTDIEIGAAQDIAGRAMVVHDSTGARVACALLPASFMV